MVNTRKKAYGESDSSDTPDVSSSTSRRSSRLSSSNLTNSSNTPIRRSRRISTSSVESTSNDVPISSITKRLDKKLPDAVSKSDVESESATNVSDCSENSQKEPQSKKGSRRNPIGTPVRRSRRLSNSSVESLSNDQKASESNPETEKDSYAAELKCTPSKRKKVSKLAPKEELVTIIEESLNPGLLSENCTQTPVKEPASTSADADCLKNEVANKNEPPLLLILDSDDPEEEINGVVTVSQDVERVVEEDCKIEEEKEQPTDSKENCVDCDKEDNPKENMSENAATNKMSETALCTSLDAQIPEKPIVDTEKLHDLKIIPPESKPAKQEPSSVPLPCGASIMQNIPRGRPKSGRLWKEPKSNPRYMYQDKGLKMPLKKIQQLRDELKRVKEIENRLKEDKRLRLEELRRRQELNKKKREENEKRGEIVQEIRNSNKIKRMKKKQLRLIQKRDTTIVG